MCNTRSHGSYKIWGKDDKERKAEETNNKDKKKKKTTFDSSELKLFGPARFMFRQVNIVVICRG